MDKSIAETVVVIPNLNGGSELLAAVDSLIKQTLKPHIIVVDNASTDGSIEKLLKKYPSIEIIRNSKNEGYAGGVNPGLKRAVEIGAEFAGPFNDDAIADKYWLESLVDSLKKDQKLGSAMPKVLGASGKYLDSTGDYYTVWGLPYPRGRGEINIDKYDDQLEIFATSGAAGLYRVSALKEVGLLDEDFFAYYEDVDLGFRLQLAGWRAAFVPSAIIYHQIGATSSKIKGFTTYQTMKNLPLLWYKNIPTKYLWHIGWRLALASTLFVARAISRGQGWPAIKGMAASGILLFKKFPERRQIQESKKVSDKYVWNSMIHDLPPNAKALRNSRAVWHKVIGRKA